MFYECLNLKKESNKITKNYPNSTWKICVTPALCSLASGTFAQSKTPAEQRLERKKNAPFMPSSSREVRRRCLLLCVSILCALILLEDCFPQTLADSNGFMNFSGNTLSMFVKKTKSFQNTLIFVMN